MLKLVCELFKSIFLIQQHPMNSIYEFYIFFHICVRYQNTRVTISQVINETNRLHTDMFMCIIE